MQTGRLIVIVIIIVVLALALGATIGYSFLTGRTSTTTKTQIYTATTSVLVGNSSTTSSSSESFQTAYNLTFTAGGNITACCVSGVRGYNTTIVTNNTTLTFTDLVTTSVGDYTVGAQLFFPISINYSGSWNLVYWVEYASGVLNDVKGNLNGSGNYQTAITFYVVGYGGATLCANATKLDNSQNNLTLSVLGSGNSTTASNPMVEVCETMGV